MWVRTHDTWTQYDGHIILHMLLTGRTICVGVLYLGYHGALVIAPKSVYDQFNPVANNWGTNHPVPDVGPTTAG
jgi:hypothetical protein